MIFTPSEVDTLEALYPNRNEWFFYLHILSDRVQEESEEWADGMRFICAIKQRPFENNKNTYWWCEGGSSFIRSGEEDEYNDYIPPEVKLSVYQEFKISTLAVTEFLTRWAALPLPTRQRLWREWVGEEVQK